MFHGKSYLNQEAFLCLSDVIFEFSVVFLVERPLQIFFEAPAD